MIKKYAYNFDFFKWIKKTELVQLVEINPEDDPVRPELDNEFRISNGRKIFGLKYNYEIEGVVCSIAENGEKAVNAVKQSTYDLILMDINMPVKNGIEATKDIRQFNTTIPIIALTAVDIEEQKNQIFECGMNDIILKPYDMYRCKCPHNSLYHH